MAENYVLLETIELTSSASSVTFDNLPSSGYTDLKIVMSGRGNGTGFGTSPWENCSLTLNGTSNTSAKQLYGTASGVGSDSQGSGIWVSDSDSTSNTFSNNEIYLPNYLSSTAKAISVDNVTENNATDTARVLWNAIYSTVTSAVTTITIATVSGSFLAGSSFSLYGIAAVGDTPAVAPKATGGNIVANDGTYWYHAFLNSGTFTPQTSLTCNVMSVGGGGGGGCFGGGGGAGELDLFSSQSLTAINYAVTIGAGGAGSKDYSLAGANGNASSFSSLVSSLGGGGGGRDGNNGLAGGSGGGGGKSGTGGSASGSNTNAGGNGGGADANVAAMGGGGGATAAGSAGTSVANTSATGGNGGQGYALSSISGLTSAMPEAFGTMTHISSGGGGGAFKTDGSGGNAPVGGTGGTGAGNGGYSRQSNSPLVGPTAPTSYGSGGGGSGSSSGGTALGNGTNGYQGIVIIRYAMA